MPSLTEKRLKIRNRNLKKLEEVDISLDALRAMGEEGSGDWDDLLADRTILFDVLVAQGCHPWEYGDKPWLCRNPLESA